MNKILFVDDDPNILAGFRRNLRGDYEVFTKEYPQEGLEFLRQNQDLAVVVADMRMPVMDGVQFLDQAKRHAPHTVRIMLTGNADRETAIEAINRGAIFRFLSKPCDVSLLKSTLMAGVRQFQLEKAERELLEQTLAGSIRVLTEVLSVADPHAFGYGERMKKYMKVFLQRFSLKRTWDLEIAAMLSHIGYAMIPASVIANSRSTGGLSEEEKEMMVRYPESGAALLARIPRLEEIAQIILYQNKNFDGTGFPDDGCSGEEIPIGARILRVLSDIARFEDQGIGSRQALQKMQRRKGVYDPGVLEAAYAAFDVYLENPKADGEEGVPIKFKELRPGHILASDVRTLDNTMVISSGHEVTPMLLERLRNFDRLRGIQSPIYVRA